MIESGRARELVVGTAGHIDHGKSRLVRSLTGIDPDRLTEEKARGMTIDLGFASLMLPSGRVVSFVDVPGHERFVANMLAGATGIHASMLVIAADEGVMPQTREHLEILDLLGIHRGLVVLTKADLIDDEMHQIAREEVDRLLSGTGLVTNPVLTVSSLSGEGLSDIIEALESLTAEMSHDRESGQPRLPVDRVFTMKGFGTVVTGTSSGGTFETGQDVEVLPGGERGRIRGLQSHGHTVHVIEPGRRTAMNLSGIERSSLVRGNVVSLPGLMRTTRRVDGLVRVLSSAPKPLKTMDMLSFHAGSAEATARVFPLESRQIEPGHSGWAQLRFDRPLTLWRRQRGVLRQMSPARTVAGAQVMDLVPRRRAREEDSTRLAGLQSEDIHEVIVALVSDRGRTASDLCCLLSIAPNRLDPLLASLHSQGRLEAIGDLYVTAVQANKLRDRVLTIVREFHSTYQLRMGITREELRRRAGISARGLADLVDSLVEAGRLATIKNTFALPTHRAGETDGADDSPGLSDLAIALRDSGLMPPGIAELRKRYDVDEEGLRYLVDRGVVVRIQSDIYIAGPAYERMTNAVVDLIDSEGQVTIARIRDSLGVTRKYALAYAEHLDARHITRRVGDGRVAGPEFHAHRT